MGVKRRKTAPEKVVQAVDEVRNPDKVIDWILSHAFTLDATGGIKPFPDYPFTRRMVETLCRERIVLAAKSRQMMATWTVCAWTLYRAIHDTPGIYLLLSKGARDTGELVKRLKVMVQTLPKDEELDIRIKQSEVVFGNDSRILALPATEDAVRMHSPTSLFWDEMAFTPHSEAIWAAVKPAIDSGGSFIGVSTPNGTDNIFYQLYSDTSNRFGKLRLHWSEHPERDEKWRLKAARGLSEARWRQEYEVDFASLADRVYDEFDLDLHILPREYRWRKGSGRTFRGIDFGYRHPYVVWLQMEPDGSLMVFDEWEGIDATVEEMADEIERIDAQYGISEDDITWTAVDPAGAAMTDSGISAVDRLKKRSMKLVWRSSGILTGVELVKSLLKDSAGRVRLRFASQAKQTVYHMQHYRWDKSKDQPVKDEGHDHAMDALRYLVINLLGQPSKSWSGANVAGAKW